MAASPRLFLVTRGARQPAGGAHREVTRPSRLWPWIRPVRGAGAGRIAIHPDRPAPGSAGFSTAPLAEPAAGRRGRLRRRPARHRPPGPRLSPVWPGGRCGGDPGDGTYLIYRRLRRNRPCRRRAADQAGGTPACRPRRPQRTRPADAAARAAGLARRGAVYPVRADAGRSCGAWPIRARRTPRRAAPAIAGAVHARPAVPGRRDAVQPDPGVDRPGARTQGAGHDRASAKLLAELDSRSRSPSAAVLSGSAGQSYTAANAFLDAWAHHQAQACLARSSAWTPYLQEVGMAGGRRGSPRGRILPRSGLHGFTPDEGGGLSERPSGRRRRPDRADQGSTSRPAARAWPSRRVSTRRSGTTRQQRPPPDRGGGRTRGCTSRICAAA